jgi:pilus assembly protein CpaE
MLSRILIAGRTASLLETLRSHLHEMPNIDVQVRIMGNGHVDPLQGLDPVPDIVLLHFAANETADLSAWAKRPAQGRPTLIVVGPGGHANATRLAIRSGARDFLPEPVSKPDLVAAVQQVCAERRIQAAHGRGTIRAFVGAAGGAGCSFIAVNIAHMLAAHAHRSVSLVDLDLVFAPTAHHLNVVSQRGLLEALDEVGSLDENALTGFGARHMSGLRLYCSTAPHAVLSKDVPPDRLATFISLLAAHNQDVVIDAPHAIDGLTATAFGLAEEVYIVMQQSTLQVRNAARLVRILRDELGVASDRLRIIVNRYAKDAALQLDDINRALRMEVTAKVPSYYQRALECSDAGVPLYEIDRGAAITASLLEVVAQMTGTTIGRPGLLRRALPAFLRN